MKALAQQAARFDLWAQDSLFQPAHRQAVALLEQAVDCYLLQLYERMDLHRRLSAGDTADAICQQLQFEDSASIALDAMLYRLATRHDFLDCVADNTGASSIYQSLCKPEDCSKQLADIEQAMQQLGADYATTLEFLRFGAQYFEHTLRDDHEFMDRVLTGLEKEHAGLWHRATNTDPLQDIHGQMGARAVDELFDGGTILEIGGGTGNGLHHNLQALHDGARLTLLERYIFTDVSMPFILTSKRALPAHLPAECCRWQLLNINKNWSQQRIEDSSIDMIYGVNAAHVAKDIVGFLRQCKAALRAGGYLVFSERIRLEARQMAPRELVLNQSLYHRTAAIRDPDYRPAHAYLTRDNWLRACTTAGFEPVSVWPSIESLAGYFPEQYAVVVVARKRTDG